MTVTPIAPLAHPTLDIYLLGFITASSLAAALFFLRFFRASRDPLFIAFAVFFFVQAFYESWAVSLSQPNEGSPWFYLVRLLAVLGVLSAILWKNFFER
jgi:4-hydroxybenzoate polyprenyltransferase